jgi:ankyrin repeat protein
MKRLIGRFALVAVFMGLCAGLFALDEAALKLLFRGSPKEVRAWADKAGLSLNEDIFVDLWPLMLIADRYDADAPETARSEIRSLYEYLIERGATVDPWSSLRVGDIARFKKQVADDPTVLAFITGTGDTLLCGAVKSGSLECLEYLLSLKPDIDGIDARGATALMYAARRGDRAMAERLIEAGAGLHVRDSEGKTALDYADSGGKASMAEYLRGKGAVL